MAGIEAIGIRKAFGATRVLNGVDLSVPEGRFVSLVGPSGCGKTTLMRIVAGLETPTAGAVHIDGRDVTGIRAADRDVAMVFQNYALYPHLTVAQNLAVPLVMRRLTTAERLPLIGRYLGEAKAKYAAIARETQQTAEMLAIGHLMQRKPAQLSGGQRQRVALGRAIVRHPRVFLMDEPLSNLDAALRVQMRTEIVALHKRVGASTVYVTHDQSEAMTMSDEVAVMMDGDILQFGTPEDIYTNPADLRVAAFVGSPRINTLAAEAGADGRVRVGEADTGVRAALSGPVTLAVRPEDLLPARTGIAARVELVEYLGDCILVHARSLAGGEALIARLPAAERSAISGESVHFSVQPEKALLFDAAGKRVRGAAQARQAAHG
ncbi:MAG: ABC transporter ATP-binding protein [Beijerinckiaceae bacterium]